jgi:hypothetical protein
LVPPIEETKGEVEHVRSTFLDRGAASGANLPQASV